MTLILPWASGDTPTCPGCGTIIKRGREYGTVNGQVLCAACVRGLETIELRGGYL